MFDVVEWLHCYIVTPGLSVLPFASLSSVILAALAAPATGSNPIARNCGANRSITSGATPVIASGVAIGFSTGALAVATVVVMVGDGFINPAKAGEAALNEISENEMERG